MVGTGKWAEYGILIKWGEPLEMACQIDTIVLDKTGTITEGKPKVTDIISLADTKESEILSIAAALELKSEHPLAAAIVWKALEMKIQTPSVEGFEAIPGRWIRGKIDGTVYLLGTRLLLEENNITLEMQSKMEHLETEGKTVMLLANEQELLGFIAVADTIKPTSLEAIARMKTLGLMVYMVTGDNARTAYAIAQKVGIEHILSDVLPENKALEVKKLQQAGKKVAMVGDGINDSPALAQADLGIAMWSGADVALESGGIIIMRNDLRDILTSIELSHQTVGKIRQNMFFAFFYNILWIPVAAGVFSTLWFILKPELAGLAMALSSVSVVMNSLLLGTFRPGYKNIFSRKIAPILMTIFFIGIFWQFAQFGNIAEAGRSYVTNNPRILSEIQSFMTNTPVKIGFDGLGLPKVFFGTDNMPSGLELRYGYTDLTQHNMIVGWSEAQMMIQEGLIQWVGDELHDFFGVEKVRIVWILKPTGTFLDDAHILSLDNYSRIMFKEDLLIIKTPLGEMKYFYLFDDTNIPVVLKSTLHPTKKSYKVNDKEYMSTYIGYDESKMMQKEKLFSQTYDTIIGLFGSNIIIAGLPKKTFTSLDMMHFVPKIFRENYLRSVNKP